MQKVVGETVKPEEFGVDQIRDISAGILSWWSRALTLIGKPAFLAACIGADAGSA
jgi:hypothetical protein